MLAYGQLFSWKIIWRELDSERMRSMSELVLNSYTIIIQNSTVSECGVIISIQRTLTPPFNCTKISFCVYVYNGKKTIII